MAGSSSTKRRIAGKSSPAATAFKPGKAPAKRDTRTIQLPSVLKGKHTFPAKWDIDFDQAENLLPTPMFYNDKLGCCVIVGRAHMTLRFEYLEQKKLLNITDKTVINAYKKEGGSLDEGTQGLVLLDSLKIWRKKGWKVGANTYKIHSFAEIAPGDITAVKTAIRFLGGACAGLSLPVSSVEQFIRGESWRVVKGPDGDPNKWNGHCVYLCGYTKTGPVCISMGRKQQMTWGFLRKHTDELYAVIDKPDTFLKRKSPVNTKMLDSILKSIQKTPPKRQPG